MILCPKLLYFFEKENQVFKKKQTNKQNKTKQNKKQTNKHTNKQTNKQNKTKAEGCVPLKDGLYASPKQDNFATD